MTFESTNDRELWLVNLGELVLPVFCRLGKIEDRKLWHVCPALGFGRSEADRIYDFLSVRCVFCDRLNFYLEDPASVAVKASGITPEFYYTGEKPLPEKHDINGVSQPAQEGLPDLRFAKHVFDHLRLDDWATFKFLYGSIFSLLPGYLIRTQEAVDLGWGRIVALPLRANWKQILLGKFPGILTIISGLNRQKVLDRLAMTDFAEESRRTDLLAVRTFDKGRQACIRWIPEIIPTEHWNNQADRMEAERAAKGGKAAYVSHVGGLVERSWGLMVEAFSSFVSQTCIPAGNLDDRNDDGVVSLAPAAQIRTYFPRSHDVRPLCVVTTSPVGKLYPLRKQDVGIEVTDLPAVPNLQPDKEDLRDSGTGS